MSKGGKLGQVAHREVARLKLQVYKSSKILSMIALAKAAAVVRH